MDKKILKKPCSNCPFLKEGAIHLNTGRLDGIKQDLLDNDYQTFHCHKTVYSAKGGTWDDNGNYHPSGKEKACAGAMAWLVAQGRPNIDTRLNFITGVIDRNFYDQAIELIDL